jgi:WD40 repeat protein
MLSNWLTLKGHGGAVYDLATDGFWLYSVSADKFVTRWNLETGQQDSFSIRLPRTAYAICVFGNQFLWVGLTSGDIHVFDLDKKREIKHLQHHKSAIFRIVCDEPNDTIFTADAEGFVSVWRSDATLLLNIPFASGKIRSISIQPDTSLIAIGSQDGVLSILDTVHFNVLDTWHAHDQGVTAVHFVGDFLYSAGKDAHICRWKKTTDKWQTTQRFPAHYQTIYDLTCTDSAKTIVSASRDACIKLWNTEDGDFLQKIDTRTGGHRHSVNRLINLRDGRMASCSDDKHIKIWKTVNT